MRSFVLIAEIVWLKGPKACWHCVSAPVQHSFSWGNGVGKGAGKKGRERKGYLVMIIDNMFDQR